MLNNLEAGTISKGTPGVYEVSGMSLFCLSVLLTTPPFSPDKNF